MKGQGGGVFKMQMRPSPRNPREGSDFCGVIMGFLIEIRHRLEIELSRGVGRHPKDNIGYTFYARKT